jgi:hypothetical protein
MEIDMETIEAAIRRVTNLILDAEWSGEDSLALRAQLKTLLAAYGRGENWNIPF